MFVRTAHIQVSVNLVPSCAAAAACWKHVVSAGTDTGPSYWSAVSPFQRVYPPTERDAYWSFHLFTFQKMLTHDRVSTSANREFPLLLGSWACCRTWSNWTWRSRFTSRDFCSMANTQDMTIQKQKEDLDSRLRHTSRADRAIIHSTYDTVMSANTGLGTDYNIWWSQVNMVFIVLYSPLRHWTSSQPLSLCPPSPLWFSPADAAGCC